VHSPERVESDTPVRISERYLNEQADEIARQWTGFAFLAGRRMNLYWLLGTSVQKKPL